MYKHESLKNRIIWIVSIVFYRIVLDVSYINFVSLDIWHDGFVFKFDWVRLAESLVACALMCAITSSRYNNKGDYFSLWLLMIVFMPLTSFYAYSKVDVLWFWMLIAQYLIFNLSLNTFVKYPLKFKLCIGDASNYKYYITTLLVAMLFVVYYVEGLTNGMVFSLSPKIVYARRAYVAEHLHMGVLSYVESWVVKVFLIYIMLDGLECKRYWQALCAWAVSILLFAILAHKAYLIVPNAALVLYFCWPKIKENYSIVPQIMGVLALATFVSFAVFNIHIYESIYIRRLLFIPAKLNFLYYDFFSTKPSLFFSNGFMSSIIDYPLEKAYPYVIGEFYQIGGKDAAANNGFLATGYMQLGWLGVVLYPTIAAGLAAIVVKLSERSSKFIVSVSFYPFMILFTSSDLPTAILTHGIGVLLLLLWMDKEVVARNV